MFTPTPTEWATLRKGDSGWKVWALQIALNTHAPSPSLVEDGDFGPKTEIAVQMVQNALSITADGIAGPTTQLHLCLAACAQMEHGRVPHRCSEGIMRGESGGSICCVSPEYPDESHDFGCAQVHLLHPTQGQLREALSPQTSILALCEELAQTHALYKGKAGCVGGKLPTWLGGGQEPKSAWCCAVLHYNWPAAASAFAYGHDTSWLAQDLEFVITATQGALHTGLQWCQKYVTSKIVGPDPTHPYVTDWSVA